MVPVLIHALLLSLTMCYDCPSSCANNACEANGPTINDIHCTVCANNLYKVIDGECLENCPVRTYYDSVARTCPSCRSDCAACSSGTDCSLCDDGFFVTVDKTDNTLSQCLIECPDGYWKDEANGKCETCDISCESCSGSLASQCRSCPTGKFLNAAGAITARESGTEVSVIIAQAAFDGTCGDTCDAEDGPISGNGNADMAMCS